MKINFNSAGYQAVLEIRREVFVKEQNVPVELEIDEFESICDYFLILKNNTPVATGRLRIKNQFIKFERIATRLPFRGLGLGRELMLEMMTYAQKHYPKLVPYMHSQLEASPFYEKLGWAPQGEIFVEAGIPHQAMIYTPHE